MGANVQDSMLYDWLTRFHAMEPHEFQEIAQGLQTDLSTRNCQIHYFFEDRAFSKSLYHSSDNDGKTWIDRMDHEALRCFGDDSFLYVANNDRKENAIDDRTNVKRISPICHGVNAYRRYTNIYFSAALNRNPKHLKVLGLLDFSIEFIRDAGPHETMYQCAMRTALRTEGDDRLIQIIVPDRFGAERLAHLIPGSQVTRIAGFNLDRKRPLSQVERDRRNRSRKVREKLVATDSLQFLTLKGFRSDPWNFIRGATVLLVS